MVGSLQRRSAQGGGLVAGASRGGAGVWVPGLRWGVVLALVATPWVGWADPQPGVPGPDAVAPPVAAEAPSNQDGAALPMPAPVTTPHGAPLGTTRLASVGGDGVSHVSTGTGFGVSFDIAQLMSFAARFRVEYAPRTDMHVAVIVGGGSPDRKDMDRYSLVEGGLQGGYYFVGDRLRGIGAVGQFIARRADGEREASSDSSLPASKVSGTAWMAHAGLMGRLASRSGIFLEFDALYGYTHSEGKAVQGANSRSATVAYPDSRFSIYFGWMQ